jgi:hypothetical protein
MRNSVVNPKIRFYREVSEWTFNPGFRIAKTYYVFYTFA